MTETCFHRFFTVEKRIEPCFFYFFINMFLTLRKNGSCMNYSWKVFWETQSDSSMVFILRVKWAQTVPSRVKLFSMKDAVSIRRSSLSSMADSASCLTADQALNSCWPITFREKHTAFISCSAAHWVLLQHFTLNLYLLSKAQRP